MLARFISLLLIICLSACASKYSARVDFNPTEPLRVAVLPFVQVDGKGNFVNTAGGLALDKVSFISEELLETPAEHMRKLTLNELTKSGLDVFPTTLVDGELSHHGLAHADLSIDFQKLFAASPAVLCTHMLNCDAVMYGKVTRWDRDYYAIQSVNAVGLDLRMISAKDGKVLFESKAEDSESRGITKIPTGFSDLVLEPVRGLDSKIITNLAARMVSKMLSQLKVENRPDYLKTSPPAIYAAAHDHAGQALNSDKPLLVLAFGSPKATASFSIGSIVQSIPMTEKEEGHYVGQFLPLPSDHFNSQPVVVSLSDELGRTTQLEIGNGPVGVN